jgi:hypothetical protein
MTARAPTMPAPVADDVWRLTLGRPLKINVFLIREDDGVAVFDSATKPLGPAVRRAADALGGATRVIVGNAHADHRGGARAIAAPVHCHLDERADVEGDGGEHYFDVSALPLLARRDAAPDAVVGRRAAARRTDARRGRPRRRGLRGRPPARARAGLHRPVARVGPPRAQQRLLRALRPVVPTPR